jgi:hypothetical protein
MATQADELLANVPLDVLADIGWQLSKSQIGSAPSDMNELVELAGKWFSAKHEEIKKNVCPRHDRIKELLTSDVSQAIQVAGDVALGAATGISPFTLGRLCIQIGIDKLCKG